MFKYTNLKKTNVLVLSLALIIFMSLFFIANNWKTDNGDIGTISQTEKIIGSNEFMGTRVPMESMEQLTVHADIVIVGKVLTDGVTKNKVLTSGTPLDDKYASLYPEKSQPRYAVCNVDIEVQKVVSGSLSTNKIVYTQMGVSGDDRLQTKVKKDDTVLLVLRKVKNEDNSYASVSFENGVFKIDSKGKVLSLSDNPTVAQYDGKGLEVLTADIKKAITKK